MYKRQEYSIIPDQIEAGTFMLAAAATKGDVTVKNVIPKHLEAISAKLLEIGCEVEEFDDAVRVVASKPLRHTQVTTLPYPGFPTDMQPQMTVVLGVAQEMCIRDRCREGGRGAWTQHLLAHRLPSGCGRSHFLSGGEHTSGHDADQSAAAGGKGDRRGFQPAL